MGKNQTTTTTFARLGANLGRTVTAHRWLTIAVSTLVVLAATVGVVWAQFSTDYRVFFSKEDPGLAAFQRLESAFTKTDNVLFVVKPAEGTIFDRKALEALQALTVEGWKLPYASRVDSLTNFQRATADAEDIVVRDLVSAPAASLSDAALAEVRRAASSEPILVGSLLSRDEKTAAVNVTIRLPGKDPLEVTRVADAARAITAKYTAAYPTLEVRASGMAFVNDAFMQASIKDMGLLFPVMFVAMLAVMALMLRSKLATIAVAAVIWMSAAAAMAVAGWLGYPLTPTSVAAPMIVITVAVADGVHVVLGMMEAMRRGMRREDAIASSLETNLEPVTYAWLTTIVGFACLNYSEAPPVAHLANMTCIGATFAYLLSITFLPALLSVLPIRAAARRSPVRSTPVTDGLASFVVRHRKPILVGAALMTAGATWMASRLEANDQFIQYFDESLPFRRDVDFTMNNLSGIYRLEYLLATEQGTTVTEPSYLRNVDAFAQWLRAQPEVEHVLSVTDIVKRVSQVIDGGADDAYRIPETVALASEALFLYEMNLPQGLGLTDRIPIDRSSSRLTVTVKNLSTREMNAFAERTVAWLRSNAPASMHTRPTGPVVIFSEMSNRNAVSMAEADLLSLALISLCMVFVLRSIGLGLLSLIPNLIPIVIGYGVWWATVGHLNVVATVAASISLGVIVDDSIHFLTRYRAARAAHPRDPFEAIRRTIAHVAPAMVGTGAILGTGFAVLTLSSFEMTSDLGWLCLSILSLAPLVDLIIAPALVLLLPSPAPTRADAPEHLLSPAVPEGRS